MPVTIESINIFNSFRPESVDWLLANVGDKIRIELVFNVRTFVVSSEEEPITVDKSNGYAGTGWVEDDSFRFTDFRIGDYILVVNRNTSTSSYHTVTDKIDDGKIQVTPAIGTRELSLDNVVFSVANPITALKYAYNFIENSDQPTFKSKLSGTEQLLVSTLIDADDTTPLNMLFIGENSYQTGSATAEGIEILDTEVYTSRFKIIHYTEITPLMLSEQWDDLEAGKFPEYFLNEKCLKAIFDIKAATEYTNPNWIQTIQINEVLGNTGGFNENFNTGITNYTVDSVVFKNADAEEIEAIELTTDETDFEIHIKNIADTPFSDNNTQFELMFSKAPFDSSEYSRNGRTIDQNFINDRAFQTVGSVAINGAQFGVAGRQCLKSVVGEFISSSEIKITGKIALLASTAAIFSESEEPRYILSLAIKNDSLETKDSDLVRLPISIEPFFIDVSDPTMIVIDNAFLRHPEQNPELDSLNTLTTFPEDEVVSYSQFYIDKNGRETDTISLSSLLVRIKAKNSVTSDEFTLDSFPISLSSLSVVSGNQFIDFSLDRVFRIPATEIRKQIKIKRRSDLDGSGKVYYDVLFPFLMRWEYWVKLTGVNDEFFDIAQPQNGTNQNWIEYDLKANWDIYLDLSIIANKNGTPLSYSQESIILMSDYDSNPDWINNTVKSYLPDGSSELYDPVSDRRFLLGYEDTLVKAEFTSNSGTPDLNDSVVNMRIEVFEEGGVEQSRRMSSRWESDSDTWFKAIDLNNKTKLALSGNTLIASVLVNKDLIPLDKKKFRISARLYSPVTQFECICPDGYVYDSITGMCKLPSDCCDPGWTLSDDGLTCERLTVVAATANPTPYTIVKAPGNGAYGNLGGRFYMPDNVTVDETINNVGSIWYNGSTTTGSRINKAGVWTGVFVGGDAQPQNEYVGFTKCLQISEAKTYFLAIAGDNLYKFSVNGTMIFPVDGGFLRQDIYEIPLNAGTNIIEVYGRNSSGPAALYAEIFDNTRAELKAATDISELTVLFSTLDKIGDNFDLGTTTGYSCPPGYALNTCAIGTPTCTLIEQSPSHCSTYVPCQGSDIERHDFNNDFNNDFNL